MTLKSKGKGQKAKVKTRNAGRGDVDAGRPVSPSSRKSSASSSQNSSTSSASRGRSSSGRGASVAIVGAGRLGTALASALDACGYEVRALVSRGASGARRAGARAGLKVMALGVEELGQLPQVELLFIATPDDALSETVERIASLLDARARVALHTSGALSSELLAPLRERGYQIGSMHRSPPLASRARARRAFDAPSIASRATRVRCAPRAVSCATSGAGASR